MKKELKIGFLGAGNMGRALALRLFLTEENVKLFFYTPSQEKARGLATLTNGTFCNSLADFPEDLDYLFLAMKPQVFNSVHIPSLSKKTILVSVMAAVTISSIKAKFSDFEVVRMMPNTPCEIGEGVFPVFSENKSIFDQMIFLKSFGQSIFCTNEFEFDQLTPLTGCLPGVLFYLMDVFRNSIDHSVLNNLNEIEQEKMIAHVLQGSLSLYFAKNKNFKHLQNEVTSKGGLTEKMIIHHEESGYDKIFKESYSKALKRSHELNQLINTKEN